MAPGDARQRLLQAAIEYVAKRGLTDLSLRELAAAIGTSHRMLIHHFGSKDELWVEVIKTVEDRQRAQLAEIVPDPDLPVDEALRAWWKHISDPSLWGNERLFFEIYGQALQGRPGTTALLDGIVEDWLEPATSINVEAGMDRATARATARLGLAVVRGLLLDLLATRDREGTAAAMDVFIALYTGAMTTEMP